MAGPKGAGLSLMIEALTSVALGNPLVSTALSDRKLMNHTRQNSLIVAMDVGVLGDMTGLKQNLASLKQSIKAEPRAEGFDEILMPGERGAREYEKRMREGIPIAVKTWAEVNELAAKLGVAPPQDIAA
jgi:ureidoglycolate dehydrogenase (NAD+)